MSWKLGGRILSEHINSALGTEIGKGHIGNIVKELGGDKRQLKGWGSCDMRIQQTCLCRWCKTQVRQTSTNVPTNNAFHCELCNTPHMQVYKK
jgi:hypothetical protein